MCYWIPSHLYCLLLKLLVLLFLSLCVFFFCWRGEGEKVVWFGLFLYFVSSALIIASNFMSVFHQYNIVSQKQTFNTKVLKGTLLVAASSCVIYQSFPDTVKTSSTLLFFLLIWLENEFYQVIYGLAWQDDLTLVIHTFLYTFTIKILCFYFPFLLCYWFSYLF